MILLKHILSYHSRNNYSKIKFRTFIYIIVKFTLHFYESNMTIVGLSACVYQRISLTAEPILFLQVQVYNYFGRGYHHPPKDKSPFNTIFSFYLKITNIAIERWRIDSSTPTPTSSASRGL